jgi:hypothetical protein
MKDEPASDSADRVAALGVLYQSERQDSATILVTSLALVAAGLTYMGIVAVLLNTSRLVGGVWISAFLAFPLWLIAAYHVLLVGTTLVRSNSIEIIEQRLLKVIGFDESTREDIGSLAGQKVLDIDKQPRVLRSQTYVSYGGVALIIIIFTIYCLTIAAKSTGWISAPVVSAEVIYALLIISSGAAWRYVLSLPGKLQERRKI